MSADGRLAFIYHERYGGRGTAHHRLSESWSRYRAIRDLLRELPLPIPHYRQAVASDTDLRRVHPQSYIDWVRQMDLRDDGFLDHRDTPAYRGIFHRAAAGVGGTLLGVRLIADGVVPMAFNPGVVCITPIETPRAASASSTIWPWRCAG